jgi:hypothetical protein
MIKRIVISVSVCLISVFFMACGTTVPKMSKRKFSEIDSLHFLHIPSQISSIRTANKSEFNKVFSDSASLLIDSSFLAALPSNIILKKLIQESDFERIKYNKECLKLMAQIESKRKIKGIIVSDSLLKGLDNQNIKYLLVTYNFGFTREKGNFGNQVAKGIGVGIITLGMFVPITIKANSTIISMIIDVPNKNLAFYHRNIGEYEPLIPKNVMRQAKESIDFYRFKVY